MTYDTTANVNVIVQKIRKAKKKHEEKEMLVFLSVLFMKT